MAPEQIPGTQSTDEYELVPRNQLEFLQREVEKLRKNPFGDSAGARDMYVVMDGLNKNISKLIAIFETANDEIVRDYKDKANTEKINMVLEQNEKLAKGIVAIADLLKEVKQLREASPAFQTLSAGASLSGPQLSAADWQPPMQSGPSEPANPFLEQPSFGTQGSSAGAQPQFGSPQQAQRRRLPPIDFSAVPPPPRR